MDSVKPIGNVPGPARSASTIAWWEARIAAETASNRARSRTAGGNAPRRYPFSATMFGSLIVQASPTPSPSARPTCAA